jgi:hypothetical protein
MMMIKETVVAGGDWYKTMGILFIPSLLQSGS